MAQAVVAVLMGSDSDFDIVKEGLEVFNKFGVAYEVRVLSAHRAPEALRQYVLDAPKKGIKVFIAAAGGAAHLGGVIAALTTLPVIGIPIHTSSLNGLDSLLSMVQMPAGVPVATVAVGSAGAKNAAIFATQILAINNQDLQSKLQKYKAELSEGVLAKDKSLQDKLKK